MIPGRLRYSVTIRRKGTTKDSFGQFTESYNTVATRRVSIEPLIGKEYWQSSGEHSAVDTRIRLRYDATLSGVKPTDEILNANTSPSQVYDILSVIRPRETKEELVLMCVRRSGG